mmetsp:Transcript_5560/g.10446  ORF Transcript_5560/g.10446 Transcript_5560/m.10446 type:complete len:498 (-) Transcript_5560:91-1584(-)
MDEEGVTRMDSAIACRYHKLPRKIEDDYHCATKVLGSGCEGDVLLATSKHGSKNSYAVKGFNLHGMSPETKEDIAREVEIFLGMDHPHIVRLLDVYESETRLDLVMECMTGGELLQRVSGKRRFTQKDAADTTWQMLLALNYLHSHNIVHRDLKLENFMYETPHNNHLRLIDFGFSQRWDPDTVMALSCGTLGYVAPDVLRHSYTTKCDTWSLGVIVFILLFGYMPFNGPEKEQMRAIMKGEYEVREKMWERVPEPAQDFVKRLLMLDPEKRLSAEAAMQHPWVKNRHHASNGSVHEETIASLCSFAQNSLMKRTCMKVAAWSLTPRQRATVRNEFLKLDTSNKGTITLSQLRQVLKEYSPDSAQLTEEALHAVSESSEEIHYSEFLAAMVSSQIALNDTLLQSTFRRFDSDNSGFITPENLRSVLGSTFDEDMIEELLAEADTSRDGKISYDEFMVFMKQGAKKEAANASTDGAFNGRSCQSCGLGSRGDAACSVQ